MLGAVGHDIGELVADQDRQFDHRFLGGERYGIFVDRLDAFRIEELENRLGARCELVIEEALEGVDHVRGGEVLAGVEFHALAQLERPGQPIVGHRPFGRQFGMKSENCRQHR